MGHTINQYENNRINSLDMLRGLMLVIMTIDHLNGYLSRFTFEPLGFVSAAEGFIFLSGYVYGFVYTKTYLRYNYNSLLIKSVKRARVIYIYHLLILLFVSFPMIMNLWEYKELIPFGDHPIKSVLLYAIFLIQPQNMDILPLYIVFILTGPFAIKIFHKQHVRLFFAISGIVWVLGQFKIFQYTQYDMKQFGLNIGYFNILCWQLLFFTGCYLGYSKTLGKMIIPISKKLIIISIIALAGFIAMNSIHSNAFIEKIVGHFAERDTLGILRMTNFAVIAYLIYVISIKYPNSLNISWLTFLGKHSLQVFAYSVCLVYFYLPFESTIKSMNDWFEIFLQVFLVASMSVPAYLHKTSVVHVPAIKSMGL